MGLNQERVVAPVIRSAYNGTGGTIAKGTIVKLSGTTHAGQVAAAAAATDPLYGVAMADIADETWGDVQIGGIAVVLAGGSVTAPAQVTSDGSGKAVTAASGNSLLGMALTSGSADELIEVELATPGGEAN